MVIRPQTAYQNRILYTAHLEDEEPVVLRDAHGALLQPRLTVYSTIALRQHTCAAISGMLCVQWH